MKLYDWQRKGVTKLLNDFKTHNKICLSWYTGAGKTNVFIELCKEILKKDPKAKIGISSYITTEIRDQIEERLKQFGLSDKIQVLKNNAQPNETKSIFVFNPQAIYRKPPEIEFDWFFVDEGHVGLFRGTKMLRKIRKKTTTSKTKLLIISATPWDTLSIEEFKDTLVYKRPLDKGFEDGLICDFKFFAEECEIEFEPKDFSKENDVLQRSITKQIDIVKSSCLGKMQNIIKRHGSKLGKKILVICPPGNASEVARYLANKLDGKLHIEKIASLNVRDELDEFKNDPKAQFLFVTKKCQVGFDMQELSTVIDLTMTRNITVLAQRLGRIARKNGDAQKNYFYVYDKSLMEDQLDWLISTVIDFSLGAYDGWSTREVKYREIKAPNFKRILQESSIPISQIIREISKEDALFSKRIVKYVNSSRPINNRTLEEAKEAMKKYSSRTHMWKENPALYKWFRLNAKKEMDSFFPFKNKQWDEEKLINILKRCASRKEFKQNYHGAAYWIYKKKRYDILDKYLPSKLESWNHDKTIKILSKINSWNELRNKQGLRSWMIRNKKLQFYKNIWEEMQEGNI